MILILIDSEFKSSETNFCTFSPEEIARMKEKGLITNKNRIYQLELNSHQYQVICPVKMENGIAVGVYLPAFKSPYRHYPCHVYLFSLALHLSGLSMRKSAKETGRKFGISKYSHPTIGRALKVLLQKVEELSTIHLAIEEKSNEELLREKNQKKQLSYPGKPAGVNIIKEDTLHKESKRILEVVLTPLLNSPNLGIKLVYQYFLKYGVLLI
jgi:hypothetical protein